MGDTAKEKLEVAHEKLKKNIGIEAMAHLCRCILRKEAWRHGQLEEHCYE